MSRLVWDQTGQKYYQHGVDRGVIYPLTSAGTYPLGYAFNGLREVQLNNDGGDPTKLYANNNVYGMSRGRVDKEGSATFYTYPDVLRECWGWREVAPGMILDQQTIKMFGMTYRIMIENDTGDENYELHFLYGVSMTPPDITAGTDEDDVEAQELDTDFTTVPVPVTGSRPVAHFLVDSRTIPAAKLAEIENIIYGTDDTNARLPLPDEIITLINTNNDPVTYTVVEPEENANPASSGWYEIVDGDYVATTDTTVVDDKTYYSRNT